MKWNDAIAAYGEDVRLIEGTRAEYFGFVEWVMSGVNDSLRGTMKSRGTLVRGKSNDLGVCDLEWSPQRRDGLEHISVSLWPAGPFGGRPANVFKIAVYLREDVVTLRGMPNELERLVSTARNCLESTDLSSPEIGEHGDASDSSYLVLGLMTVPMDAPDLLKRISGAFRSACVAAEAASEGLAGEIGGSLLSWSLLRLQEIWDSMPLPVGEPKVSWVGSSLQSRCNIYSYYLQVDVSGTGSVFLAVGDDADGLCILPEGAKGRDKSFIDWLAREHRATSFERGGYWFIPVIPEDEATALFKSDDRGGYRKRAGDALAGAVDHLVNLGKEQTT